MDYGAILHRAWDIAWRNKTLWWLGLFAGGASYSSFNSSYRLNRGDFPSRFNGQFAPLSDLSRADIGSFMSRWLPLIIVVVLLLMLVGVLLLVLSVAARGGLISEVDLAARGGRPSASRGWGEGFGRWGRIAAIIAVLSLPFVVLGLVVTAIGLFALLIPFAAGSSPNVAGVGAFVGVLVLGTLVLIPLGIVLGVLQVLALRYALLEDFIWSKSISAGWSVIRTRFKDVALMWLILVAVAFGYGFAVVLALLVFAVPLVGLAIGRLWIVFALLVGVMIVALWVLGAWFNTFHSAAWTIFWRQMTGREPGRPAAQWVSPSPQPGWQPSPSTYPQYPQYPPQPPYPPQAPYPPPGAPLAPEAPAPEAPPPPVQPTAPPSSDPPPGDVPG